MSITDCTRPTCRAAVFYVLYKCSQVPVLLSDATEVSSFVTIGRCYLVVSKAGAKLHHTLHVLAGLGRQLSVPLQGQGLRCAVPNGSASDPGQHGDRI